MFWSQRCFQFKYRYVYKVRINSKGKKNKHVHSIAGSSVQCGTYVLVLIGERT